MTEPFMLDLHTYLGRLGYSSAPPPTLDTLRELQARHTAEFPFETLASMLRVPVEVEPAAIQDKLLRQGRGGYCFELNRLYLLLLQALRFDARGLTGRVVMGGPGDALPARTHMLVLVTLGGVLRDVLRVLQAPVRLGLVENSSRVEVGGFVAGEWVRKLEWLVSLGRLEVAECAVDTGPGL